MKARVAAVLKRRPLLNAALVAVVSVIGASVSVPGAIGAAVLAGIAGGVFRGWRTGCVWAVCGLLAAGNFLAREHFREAAERDLAVRGVAEIEARVTDDARPRGQGWAAQAVLTAGDHRGTKVWWEGRGELPVAGAVVRGRGNFRALPEPRNPGEFDKGGWLRGQGVAAVFKSLGQVKVETGTRAAIGAKVRRGFREAVTAGLPPDSREAQVILAVVVGERPADADELVAAFRHSGTLHLFTVSGLHVGLVGVIGWLVLSAIGVPRRWAVVLLLPLVFGYAWITGNGPPAVRSAWMMAVFLGAFVFRRQPDLLNSLGAVLLAALLWDGRLLFNTGVQLSYGVVAAIGIGTAWAVRAFGWMKTPEPYLPSGLMSRLQVIWLHFRQKLAGSLAVSSAACVGSMPLSAYHFGLIAPISVLASVALLVPVWLMLALALLSAAVFPVVPAASGVLNRANGCLANGCVWMAERFAAVPGGHFLTRSTSEPFLLVYDLDFGAGAAVFSGGKEGAVLIDCGDGFAFKQRLAPSLRELGVRPDSIVLTHPDGGHLGGGRQVWENLPMKQALLPVERSRSPTFRSWAADGREAGLRMRVPVEGEVFPLPAGATLEILHVPDPLAQNAIADDRAMLLRLHWGGWKILFTSDAGSAAEQELLASGKDLAADLIVAGRHRRDLTLGDDFLAAVNPLAIIASHSEFPLAERLPQRQADYWKSRGIAVIDQGRTGGVTVRLMDEGLELGGFADGSSVVLKRR